MLGLDRKDGLGLATNMIAFAAAVLIANGYILVVNPVEMSNSRPSSLTPPGFVIGLVWVGLFLCMAVVRWALVRSGPNTRVPQLALTAFATACALYPVYTQGLQSLKIGLLANGLLFVATVYLIVLMWRTIRRITLWLAPIALWLAYASAATLQQMGVIR